MESLVNKLNKWYELKKEHTRLMHERREREVRRIVEEAKKTQNIEMLLEILTTDADKCKDLEGFLTSEFKRSIAFNSKERINQIIKCMCILGLKREKPRLMMIDHLESVYSKTRKPSTVSRIELLKKLQEYDETNGLKIHEYIENRIDEEVDEYVRKIPLEAPKELDRWLNEMVGVGRYRPRLLQMYKDLEIKYFTMCLGIVMLGDKESAVEDIVYLVNKIRLRSNTVGVSIDNEVMEKLNECKMLWEEEIKALFHHCEQL
ncbi:uncharacterized protein Eint_090430 [Encephalitozoon intestinalis ATCC 50506]|uniref:Uncharacterized protein n=1 Tax=Encephalitozoon intestinalis (strain ATCC 50506) TaxID=876142 RepID=E0S9A8_ENCIT|nr:uncharacterized protein Eint_090430 [Encephalitozoon intestinalis ATCC 50506]ADM12172.1 hypothetical protein Eint_090430 [Encephalitozoon intestinalis ATCC 50506]UTX45974.1 hypothetical protein GPK93_09g15600 [Encephalitozoon intestinalis]